MSLINLCPTFTPREGYYSSTGTTTLQALYGGSSPKLLNEHKRCRNEDLLKQIRANLEDKVLFEDGSIDETLLRLWTYQHTVVLTTSTSQVLMKSNGKSVRIINETVEEVMSDTLYGDSIRLKEVLADFMLMAVNFTPSGGHLTVTASLRKDQLRRSVHLAYLEIRMTHTGVGIPELLLNQMFGTEEDVSEEGLNLMVSRKLVKLMNGDVQYLRQAGKSSFIITAELTAANK